MFTPSLLVCVLCLFSPSSSFRTCVCGTAVRDVCLIFPLSFFDLLVTLPSNLGRHFLHRIGRLSCNRSNLPTQALLTTDSMPRPSRTRVQTRAITPQDEAFDIDDVSDNDDVSDSDDDNELPRANHGPHAEPSAQKTYPVNDPDVCHVSKNTAHDIHYFFQKIGENNVCTVCKYVFLRSWLFSFLI